MNIFKKIAAPGKYQDENSIPHLVDYIMNPNKTKHKVVGGYGINPNDIAESMIAVSEKFRKNSRIRLHHFMVSLDNRDTYTTSELKEIGEMLCAHTTGNFQTIFALHEDTGYLHFHVMFNAVSYRDGHRYRGTIQEYYQLFNWVDAVISQYSSAPVIAVNYYPEPNNPDE